MLDFLLYLEKSIFQLINGTRFAFLDIVLPLFSQTWIFILVIIIFLFFLRKKYTKFELLVLICAIALSVGLANTSCDLIKSASGRLRPYQSMENVYYQDAGEWKQTTAADLRPPDSRGSSFCSAHVANTTAVVITIILLVNVAKINFLLLLPLFVAWSRLYLGKHFFSDVFVGYFVGLFSAVLVYCCLVAFRTYLNKKYKN